MKHILYLMHIPWGWLKQRPHFLAENLAKHSMIDVYYRKANTVSKNAMLTTKSNISNLSIKGYNELPFDKIPILKYLHLEWINTLIIKYQIPKLKRYDYIWLTSPFQYLALKPLLKRQKVVYDCMDDILEFPNIRKNPRLVSKLFHLERDLLTSADYVIVSSEYLKNKILERANVIRRDVIVVNNAIELPAKRYNALLPESIKEKICFIKSLSYPFMYIGMISPWFDFDLVLQVLERYPMLDVVLIGPCEVEIPKHERIHYLGLVERKHIFPLMEVAFALMMPFKLNELIYAVNPVKLYEYIYMKKPIICIRYAETEKFSDYVCLYSTVDECIDKIGRILKNPQINIQSENAIQEFIEKNTWCYRSKQIEQILHL